MDRNILFKKACLRPHDEGQEEVTAMCFNKDCPSRLACKYCYKEPFHKDHLAELLNFDVIPIVYKKAFAEYNTLGIEKRIAIQTKLFRSAKEALIHTISLLEIDFENDIKRLVEIDNIIKESIRIAETKNLQSITEQHAQILVNLKENNISPQMDEMTSLPIIQELEEINTSLKNKLKFINLEQFIEKHCKDKKLIKFYNNKQLDYEQCPPNLKFVLGFDNRDIKQGEYIYFGGVVNGLQQGRGISIDKNGHQILEGIWSNGQLKWGQKAELNSVNLAYIQTGEFLNEEIEGQGLAQYADGEMQLNVLFKYEGEFKQGKREGFGIIKWPDGDSYEGQWKNDMREGKGCYRWKNGDLYEGNWKNNRIEGQGRFKYPNEEYILGSFQQQKQSEQNSNSPQQIIIYDKNGNFRTTVWMK